ncbi:pol-like protein [Purpureocillium lavendulum]|uniref:Pol-like protein n=1 Tax=Purpureocillium lavendulum TaxID=1247861 RepID=A0AB34FEB6_9HYPO|nr:pol-like protein [Purpureocillium lavendulum]
MTEEERLLLHQYLYAWGQWWTVQKSTEHEPYAGRGKRSRVDIGAPSVPPNQTAFEQETREFSQWMWNTWDETISPYYLK